MTTAKLSVLVALIGCSKRHDEARPAPPCLADEVTSLHAAWTQLEDCTVEETACYAACFSGDGDACMSRAIAVEAVRRGEARRLFGQACKLGWALGCTNYGAGLWSDAKSPEDEACAARLFARACEVSDSMGCGMVGRFLVEDRAHPEEQARGRKFLEDACQKHKGPPCRMLAFYLERGMFGTTERAKLDELMQRACEGGDAVACGEHATVEETFHD